MASTQLPQPTRSQVGKPEESEFQHQPHMVSLSVEFQHQPHMVSLSVQSLLSFNTNPTWWVYRCNLSVVQVRDTLNRVLISLLFSPAFDRAFDHLQLIKTTLIFKMQKALYNK